jgi:hypothetical protein
MIEIVRHLHKVQNARNMIYNNVMSLEGRLALY